MDEKLTDLQLIKKYLDEGGDRLPNYTYKKSSAGIRLENDIKEAKGLVQQLDDYFKNSK